MEQPAFRSGRITCWPGARQHVGAFRHEVHAAEDDVLGVGLRGDLRELVAVAGGVGKADHFVALVVVAEDHDGRAQPRARRARCARPSSGREAPGSFQGCNVPSAAGRRQHFIKNRFTVFRLQSASFGTRTGMLKANCGCSGCTGADFSTGRLAAHPRGCCSPFYRRIRPGRGTECQARSPPFTSL